MGQQPQTAVDARPNWRDACLVVLDLAALSNMFLVLDHHGKAHPVLCVQSGMRLPKGAVRGNHIPVYALEMGCRFPEGASGKRHPILSPKSGIRFPAGMKKAPTAHMNCGGLCVAVHCVWVVEMSRFAPKEEGIDLRVMPDE